MAEAEVGEFLTHLARDGKVSPSTQNQALSALLFLYKEVLQQEIGWLEGVERAKKPVRLPVILTRAEVEKILQHLHGTHRLMAELLYGSGLRLMECVRLRVKDIDFAYAHILVRDGKGGKDRLTMLPIHCAPRLQRHLLLRIRRRARKYSSRVGLTGYSRVLATRSESGALAWAERNSRT